MTNKPRASFSSKRGAFTLVELLVVISIILVASSVIFIGSGGGEGAKLSTAQRILSGVAQGARGQAILKKAPTRLVIYSELATNTDDSKKLRFVGIVYQADDDLWYPATQGTYLPEGIYFNPDLGVSRLSGVSVPTTMTMNYPVRTGQNGTAGSDEYHFVEFSENGTLSSDFQNVWLALQAGVLKPGSSGSTLEIFFPVDDPGLESLENIKSALIFRKAGTTTPVLEPNDI